MSSRTHAQQSNFICSPSTPYCERRCPTLEVDAPMQCSICSHRVAGQSNQLETGRTALKCPITQYSSAKHSVPHHLGDAALFSDASVILTEFPHKLGAKYAIGWHRALMSLQTFIHDQTFLPVASLLPPFHSNFAMRPEIVQV